MSRRDNQNNDIVRAAGEHVFALFREAAKDGKLVYHGYDRSRELAQATKEIAKGSDLDEEQTLRALLAAWFYDAGYAAGPQADRSQSAGLMRKFLAEQGQPDALAEAVEATLRGESEHAHQNAAQEVLHDALLVPMASKGYLRKLRLLRLEKERRGGPPVADIEWTESCIRYLDQHPFRTRYAQIEYNAGRAGNVVRLHNLLQEQREDAAELRADAEKEFKGVGRTVESLYREVNRSQLQMLGLTDKRTSTMVHVNAIMISLIVGLLLRHIDERHHLLVPTIILLAVNLATIFISIASMRLSRAASGVQDVDGDAHDANLLTLTNPLPMNRHEYSFRIEKLAQDAPALRKSMIEATYFARRMLAWRGQMVRLSYDVFIGGLVVSVVAFVVAILHK
jgi:hypothetical protein